MANKYYRNRKFLDLSKPIWLFRCPLRMLFHNGSVLSKIVINHFNISLFLFTDLEIFGSQTKPPGRPAELTSPEISPSHETDQVLGAILTLNQVNFTDNHNNYFK